MSKYLKKRKAMLVYLDVMDSILLKSTDRSFHVLFYIILQTNQITNVWHSDKTNKEKIMIELNMSAISLAKHLASLKSRKLILPQSQRGRYCLNKSIFSLDVSNY